MESVESAQAKASQQPTYLELIRDSPAKVPATAGVTGTSPDKSTEPTKPTKTKRERADENWKILDIIITESEQFERGSDERSKCLDKLHQVLRQISKRPRTEKLLSPRSNRNEYSNASEEWDDFLAPTCEVCGLFADGGCKCDELEEHVNSFLAPTTGDDCGSSASAVGGAEEPAI